MKILSKVLIVLIFSSMTRLAMAAFPQDFSDVVWVGPDISSWEVTSTLEVSINGGTINLPHTKRDSWPITNCRFPASERVNASVWGFVKLNGVWHAGTFEYLRAGGTTRKTSTFGGPGYFRPPINTFRPINGELYGFMIAGISRDSLNCVNVDERTNVVLYRWGEGPVDFDAAEPEPEAAPIVAPQTLILSD